MEQHDLKMAEIDDKLKGLIDIVQSLQASVRFPQQSAAR